ncbi:heavy metal translocating P-type ATPase [Bifidobacterium longum]|uniref:Cadmium, zinc and cobalt-transporting ATPase n=1 Tax=Bifidobacterium longum subsp. infantis TaxID=1682 RepID=A0A564RYQ2_BIFLI|nr:heavy metal translocating P-type ATPase [Bifidobacterium longum]VUW83184.1 Cadmium, zinc and cobalt-transporting ATPase [Bifidobacterium longum subsp. infantis]
MSALIRFFTQILDICRLVPMLPVVVIAAIPLALLGDWHPWGHAADIAMLGDPGFGQWLIIALVLIIVADTVRGMIDDLRHGQVGVDLLAVVAILSTVAVHEYWASWAVMLMVTSGEAIEEYAQAKAEHSLTALVEAAPRTAHVVSLPGVGRDLAGDAGDASEGFRRVGQFATASAAHRFDTVPVEQVRLGDVLMVLPGETVPVDGELLSGSATLDLSNINGEPVPREVFAGARVMSGAVNGSSALTMRATQVAADSQYQRILELVASAQESRPAVVKTADRLAVPFTVLSLVIAGVAWAVSGLPTRFAQVLVLATPCPLLIAAPVAYIAGTGRLAAAGVLIKAQDVLENLGRVTQVFFDKTGTLTVKQPQVVRVEMLPGAATQFDGDHVLMMAGVVESYSVHILSKGIAKAGTEAMARLRRQSENDGRPCPESDAVWFGVGREHPVVKGINEEAGKGVSGEVNGHVVRVGRLSFAAAGKDGFLTAGNADPTGPRHDPRPGTETAGGTEEDVRTRFGLLQPDEMASYVSIDGRLIARIVLRDVPRANAGTALAKLHALGVAKLAMLTGDKRASADIIANEVGIDEVHAELFPEDKVAAVKSAAEDGNAVTMMVGDGVNDAPVLAVADIGVAMTDGTSTAASESAQVVIMTDDIAAVPRAIAIARRTKRVMLQAVIVGLALAVIGMIAAAFDLIPVVVGAFLQEAIDVVSILWALTALIDRD